MGQRKGKKSKKKTAPPRGARAAKRGPAADGPRLVTRQELAVELAVTPGTITRWEKDGMPVAKRAPRGQPSLFDVDAVRTWRAGVEAAALEETLSLSEERAKLAQRQREKLELDLQVRRGQLLEREMVVLAGQAYTKAWRAKVRGLPRRAVQMGVIPRELEPELARLCHDLLTDIADWQVPTEDEGAA
jgi:phage terminase Nu1 subunit (DNA packaging protein)